MASNSNKTTNADHQRKWKEQNKGTVKLENCKYQVNQLSKIIEDPDYDQKVKNDMARRQRESRERKKAMLLEQNKENEDQMCF